MTIPSGPVGQPEFEDLEAVIEATAQRILRALSGTDSATVPPRTEEAARCIWETIYGHLRGRVPFPMRPDLMGVAVSAGIRIAQGMAEAGALALSRQGGAEGVVPFRHWNGFLISEKVVLNRYRQRTA